ncbi:hypothetical protein EVAR_100396_1 [Eumeta japonica]|uniref:Uncharacterized protein n=1 Tax=Eumeta variegata TaxID=151549 RepID=A0A4C2AB94_EUMVA|nr:hypothetical protein EVAR_100396_1 [Eumeta japonica]
MRLIERIYERCATYNCRYCPFPGKFDGRNSLTNALKDFLILLCFFVANFVVMFTVLTRIAVHVSFFVIDVVEWMRRNESRHKNLEIECIDHSCVVAGNRSTSHSDSQKSCTKRLTPFR